MVESGETVKVEEATYEIVDIGVNGRTMGEHRGCGHVTFVLKQVESPKEYLGVGFEGVKTVDGSLPNVTLEDIQREAEEEIAERKESERIEREWRELTKKGKLQYSYLIGKKVTVKTS